MSRLGLIVAALAASMVAAIGEDGVLALTPDTFKKHVGSDKPALVEFYAPWCGHCKSLAPEYATLSETFKGAPVVIAKVDADAHGDLGSKFGVQGFPTLKWFPAGSSTPEDYTGGRTAEDLVSFVNGKIGTSRRVKSTPSSVVALTPESFDAVVADPSKNVLVEFYAPWCGHCKSLAPVYEKVGAAFAGESSVVVAKVDADKHRELGSRFGVQGFPTLKFFPAEAGKPEDTVQEYEGGRDGASLVSFLNEKAGTFRTLDGGLTAAAGRVPELDVFAAAFASAADKAAALSEARAAVAALPASSRSAGEAYLKVMARIAEKGAAWLDKEATRVAGMLKGGALSNAKKTELALKANVLAAFKGTPLPAAAGKGEEEQEL